MNAFQAKRAAKIQRYRELSAKASDRSDASYQGAKNITSFIPLGQPIMIGHHSEGRHRRDVARVESFMQRCLSENRKSDYYARKVAAAENNTSISSDDPDALDKLREKLEGLQKKQERMKYINKVHAAYLKNNQSIQKYTDLTEKEVSTIINYVPKYSWEKHPFPPYAITNNGANIRTVEKRIQVLENKSKLETKEKTYKDGIRVVQNVEENRLQVFFPGKPDEETRKKLKSGGFRWSPTNACWQAYLTRNSSFNLEHMGIL